MAARMLNPLVAAEMRYEQMRDVIKDLSLFGFDEFRQRKGIIKLQGLDQGDGIHSVPWHH